MLENAVYRIKTQLGISTEGYSHSANSPVYGTGQGSKSSALLWNVNGSTYFNEYDQRCEGAHYKDPTRKLTLKIGMAGFVDDNTSQTNGPSTNRPSLIAHATSAAQLWSDILYSSGGVLEHSKCSYHYILTDFDQHGAPVLRAGSHGDPITIHDHQASPTTLQQISVYTPYKTLGTYQCPGSAQRGQSDALLSPYTCQQHLPRRSRLDVLH